MGFPAVFDVKTINGTNGFLIYPTVTSVTGARDINNDGYNDTLVGQNNLNNLGTSVIFGTPNAYPATGFNLNTLNGNNGFTTNILSTSISCAGDINHDGIPDILIGDFFNYPSLNPNINGQSGNAYAILGSNNPFPASFTWESINGNNGMRIYDNTDYATSPNSFGFSIAGGGDYNGDDISDLLVGMPYAWADGGALIFFGNKLLPTFIELWSNVNGANGFWFSTSNDNNKFQGCGTSVSNLGDINADGIDDLAMGCTNGYSAVLYGTTTPYSEAYSAPTPASLNGKNGFLINQSAFALSGGHDVNGDGIDDFIIGNPTLNYKSGGAFVIFGNATGFPAEFNTNVLNGGNGFVIPGLARDDGLGTSVQITPDLNGDNMADILITAPAKGNGVGYVIYGANNFTQLFNLEDLNGQNGFKIITSEEFYTPLQLGSSFNGAGDLNGDGCPDLLIGQLGQGTAYAIYGEC